MEADQEPVGYRQCVEEAAPEVVAEAEPDSPGERPADEGSAVAAAAAVEPTGVASVDAALERLRDLDGAPVEAHVEIFDDVQRQLHEALAELEE
jgi:hypothetical protein